MEIYVAPEMELARGKNASDPVRLRQVSVGAGYRHGDTFTYADRTVGSSWGPFSSNRNGHKVGRNGNVAAQVEVSGSLGSETAVSLRGRAAWDRDNEGTASLEEGYLKTRTGAWAWEAGREALTWGQGASGHLLLGNNMKPLTTVQAHLNEPIQAGGFLKFLGQVDFHAFYGRLDGERAEDALGAGRRDYDHPGLLGLRLDGNGLSHSDWGHWVSGHNADTHDKWDDIGGFDFRLRLPGVQFYGELYGEDQAHGLPSDWGWRGGMVLPQLTRDGAWDLTLETAYTNKDWYRHGTYQQGWTYSGDILGDAMGTDSRSYYARVNHYLPGETRLGLYYQRMEKDRSQAGTRVDEVAFTGRKKLRQDLYLDGTLGYARIRQGSADHTWFAGAQVDWQL